MNILLNINCSKISPKRRGFCLRIGDESYSKGTKHKMYWAVWVWQHHRQMFNLQQGERLSSAEEGDREWTASEWQGDGTAGQRPCCRQWCGPTLTGIHSAQHPAVSTSAPFLTRLWRKSVLMAQLQDTIPWRVDLFVWLKATLTEWREDRFLFFF